LNKQTIKKKVGIPPTSTTPTNHSSPLNYLKASQPHQLIIPLHSIISKPMDNSINRDIMSWRIYKELKGSCKIMRRWLEASTQA
ncbi:unnamed protein product, partial [Linum tenue]